MSRSPGAAPIGNHNPCHPQRPKGSAFFGFLRRWRHALSGIVWQFIGLSLIFVLPVVVFGAAEVWRRTDVDYANASRLLTTEAEYLTDRLRERIAAGRELLTALAQIPAVRGQDPDACGSLLRAILRQYDHYSAISKVDTAGRIVCSSDQVSRPVDVSREPNIVHTLTTGEFSISPLRIGPTSGKPIVVLTQPILDPQGKPLGIIAAGLLMSWVSDLAHGIGRDQDHEHSSRLVVYSGTGTILADSLCGRSCVGTPLDRHGLGALLPLHASGASTVVLQGETHLVGTAALPEVLEGVFVTAICSREAVIAVIERQIAHQILILIAVVIACLLFAIFAPRALVKRWIDRLADTASRIAEGDLGARVARSGSRNEFGELARLYNTMAARIEARDAAARRALVLAKEQAEHANRAKSNFLAMMSHELRTPLNAIIGFGQLLRSGETDPRRQQSFEMMEAAGRTLLQLIDDILDISKIEAGKRQTIESVFDLHHELNGLTALLIPQAQAKGTVLDLAIDPAVPVRVRGDAKALRQILINLIGNAVKFTASGRITVVASAPAATGTNGAAQSALEIAVADTGPGIPAEQRERIFEAFEQGGTVTGGTRAGVGLGLAIVRRLLDLVGGRIWVDSEPGRGSRFAFTFPIVPEPGEQTPGPAPLPSPAAADPVSARILVVEDDPASRRLLLEVRRSGGYAVETEADGARALDRLAAERFDLVITDIRMPSMNGLEMIRRIRTGLAAPCPQDLPIIAVTAFAMAGDRETILATGANAYLSKPIDVTRIEEIVQTALAGRERRDETEPRGSAALEKAIP